MHGEAAPERSSLNPEAGPLKSLRPWTDGRGLFIDIYIYSVYIPSWLSSSHSLYTCMQSGPSYSPLHFEDMPFEMTDIYRPKKYRPQLAWIFVPELGKRKRFTIHDKEHLKRGHIPVSDAILVWRDFDCKTCKAKILWSFHEMSGLPSKAYLEDEDGPTVFYEIDTNVSDEPGDYTAFPSFLWR